MRKHLFFIFNLILVSTLCFAQIIPEPQSTTFLGAKHREFYASPTVHITTELAQNAVAWLQEKIANLNSTPAATEATLLCSTPTPNLDLPAEGYRLTIDLNQITIEANSERGFLHGAASLYQLYAYHKTEGAIPTQKIEDAPDFSFRAIMHDVGRNFQSIEMLKKNIDFMVLYKMNTFHWHLTDNPAWRIECKSYPILNNPRYQRKGRKEGSFYRYDEIRDLIHYANERGIQVIPELDMPGHSQYFRRAFLTQMYSKRGMKIMETLIHEFCSEIPKELAPIIHLGSDEVHLPNKEEFMGRMSAALKAEEREIMVWAPGLEPPEGSILQNWSSAPLKKDWKTVDSQGLYCADFDPLFNIKEIYFMPVCQVQNKEITKNTLGATLCVWNDVRVADESEIYRNNPVWTSAITLADRTWNYQNHTEDDFHHFEERLLQHKKLFHQDKDFVYLPESHIEWEITTDNGITSTAKGWSVNLNPLKDKGATSATLKATINCENATDLPVAIGFDLAIRPSRQYGGIPQQGCWDKAGSKVYLNDSEILPAPWKKPGQLDHSFAQTWHMPIAEVPWSAEELYWLREPVILHLKAGENTLRIETKLGFKVQHWICGVVPTQAR